MSSKSSESEVESRRSRRKRKPSKKVLEAMDESSESEAMQPQAVVKQKQKSKRKSIVRGGKSGQKTADEASTLLKSKEEKTKQDISRLSLTDCQSLLLKVLERVPGILFDILESVPPEPPRPNPDPVVEWCTCTNCRPMPTLLERVCCGANPTDCVSKRPEMDIAILDETVIGIALAHQQDLLGYGEYNANDADADISRAYRYGAYRQFVLWEYGRLGKGVRAVIPSCCVIRIRTRYPDPFNQYVGFKIADGRLGAQQ